MTSSTFRGNSGSSSRNSTPLWAVKLLPDAVSPRRRSARRRKSCGAASEMDTTRPAPPGIEHARHAVDFRRLQRFLKRKRRQNGRDSLGQHRLPRPRRPNHQNVMSPGTGDFEGALGGLLSANVFEVHRKMLCLPLAATPGPPPLAKSHCPCSQNGLRQAAT